MINSMTGFAAQSGQGAGHAWVWEVRGVNGKGLDLRLRLPDWIAGLEPAARAAVQGRVARGSLTLGLRIARADPEAGAARIDKAALEGALIMLKHVQAAAHEHHLTLRDPTAVEILSMRGVADTAAPEIDTKVLLADLMADLDLAIASFLEMRAAEGAELATVLGRQLDTVARLITLAAAEAELRRDKMAETLRANLARVLDNAEGADPDRVAQELALIAVKADIREEIDRLGAHVAAARALLTEAGPVGRKLDFLMQEFNREANTLCAKAQSATLTRIGLDLKGVIDQMREQVQNVE
ncbi:MAG: YicC family protein [Rhodobacteraceae bacterium]|nr:YicC family protein [Paracoccaceae bacterium]